MELCINRILLIDKPAPLPGESEEKPSNLPEDLDARRLELREQMQALLARMFDLRIEELQEELRELEIRLERQRRRLKRFQEAKQGEVERRLESMLGDGSPDW